MSADAHVANIRAESASREMRGSLCAPGPRPERVYTHAVLLELKMHPLAQIWPEYLSALYKNTRGVWDPDRWHHEQRRSETPLVKEDGEELRKDGEKEAENIILSPQRGSFISGCQAAAKDELNLRPDMPGAGGRRVGSGRILRPEKEEAPPPHRGARVRVEREPARGGDWEQREFSKYGFRREEEERRGWEERREPYPDERGMDRRRGRGGGMGGGGMNRRRDNEPEWMHESVALTDIIELKGFDDKGGRGSRPNSRQSMKSDQSGPAGRGPRQQSGPKGALGAIQPAPGIPQPQDKDGFNFDHIMEAMNLNSILDDGEVEEQPVPGHQGGGGGQSRFSQFFQPRPDSRTQSRRSSIQDELLGSNILREINGEPTIKIPSPNDSNKYFTPISPAAKTMKGNNVLLDMLQKGNQGKVEETMVQKLEDGIKRSLGLEEGIRGTDDGLKRSMGIDPRLLQLQQRVQQEQAAHHLQQQQLMQQQQQRQQSTQDNDLSAFKKLVAQVKGQPGEQRPAPGFQPPGLVRPTPVSALTEHDILEGRGGGGGGGQRFMGFPALPIQLLQFLEQYPLNREVLRRSEAEHLLNCINNGTVPIESLVPHLSNPALPARQRELILSVLKLKTLSASSVLAAPPMAPPRSSPLNEFLLSQPPPVHHSRVSPLLFSGAGPGQSHLSVSPVPQTQRVPSPQEMTVLTQHILQQALIKKKLEEQKENYRKKQETGKQDEKENIRGFRVHENGSSSSPLAFTPTSVMRKNAADRKDSDPRTGVPELKITGQEEQGGIQAPVSPGRPILKGGGGGVDRPMVLDLGARSTHGNPGLEGVHALPHPGAHNLPAGFMTGGQPNSHLAGSQPNPHLAAGQANPLLYLANQQMQPPVMGHGGAAQFAGILNALPNGGKPLFGGGRYLPRSMRGPVGRAGPPSPTGGPPAPNTLSRFFSNDVLAAAAASGGVGPPKMPPLPTGQALTLEEIERHAAAVKI